MIADSKEVWILEIAGRWWVAEHIKSGVRTISNSPLIRGKGTLRREGIVQYAISKDLIRNDDEFDFARHFSEGGFEGQSGSYSRYSRSLELIKSESPKITEKKKMNFLRDHYSGICMYGGFTSTASQVSKIYSDDSTINWFTNASNPCLNFYKWYVFPYTQGEAIASGPYSVKDPNWNWSKFEQFKLIIDNFDQNEKANYKNEIDTIENVLITQVKELKIKYPIKQNNEFNRLIHEISLYASKKMNELYLKYK